MRQLDTSVPLNLLEIITRRFIRQVSPLSLLLLPARHLPQDDLMKQCRRGRKEFRFWLFNDSILYGESNGLGAFRPSHLIPLSQCRVTAVDENSEPAMRIESPKKSFYVWMKSVSFSFHLCSPSLSLSSSLCLISSPLTSNPSHLSPLSCGLQIG
jgi:hypothetical protein